MPDYNFEDLFGQLNQIIQSQGFGQAVDPNITNPIQGLTALMDFIAQGDKRSFYANNNTIGDRIARNTVEASYYPGGGQTPMIPFQAEKGEVIVLPDVSVVDVKAKEEHKKMDDDEITDYAPDGYVVSNRIKAPKDFGETILGYSGTYYSETEKDDSEVDDVDIEDFIGKIKKGMTMADVTKKIRDKVPLTEDKSDAFNKRTNAMNKQTRTDLLSAVIAYNEEKRQQSETKPMQYKKGGVIKAPLGFDVGSILSAVLQIPQVIAQQAATAAAGKRAKKFKDQSLQDLQALNDQTQQNLGLGLVNTLAGIAGQDPNEKAANYQEAFDYLKQQYDRIPESIKQGAYNRIGRSINPAIANAFGATTNFGRAANLAANLTGQSLNQQADLAGNFAMQDVGLRNSYLGRLAQMSQTQAAENTRAENLTRTNQNQLVAARSDAGNAYLQGITSLGERNFSNRQLINAGYENTINQVQQNQVNTLSTLPTLGAAAGSVYNGVINPNTPQTSAPIQGNIGSGYYVPGQYLQGVPSILPNGSGYNNGIGLGAPYTPTGVSPYQSSPYGLSIYGG